MSDTIEFRFRRRYALPPTDPRFLDATVEQVVLDYWAHRHLDDPNLRNEVVNDEFEADLAAAEAEAGIPPEPDMPDEDFETVVDGFGSE